MRKYEVLGLLNHGISSVLLQDYSVGAFFAFFVKVLKNLRKCMPKWLQNALKSSLEAPWGSIFEVLRGFGRALIFDEFWDGEKVNQKSEKFDI